jgi:hypothetical protein
MFAVPIVAALSWTTTASAQGAPPPAPASKWYDKIKLEGFVDAYFNLNWNFPRPQTGTDLGRAFDFNNGFSVNWVGLNASYAPDPVGATVGLRFGPGAGIYNAAAFQSNSADNQFALTYVKQAFVSWKPGLGPIELDFGKFDTWIGAEVADTQYNMTYTRSTLFFFQPLFHTGLRLDYPINDQFDVKAFVVNGWNNSVDNNIGKSFGASVAFTPSKTMAFYANYIGGPEQNDSFVQPVTNIVRPVPGADSRWRHLFDAVGDLHFDKLHLLFNADLGTEKFPPGGLGTNTTDASATWWGFNATAGYAILDQFAVAGRFGYFSDVDGIFATTWGAPAFFKTSEIDATLTLAYTPTPNLLFKLEPRLDAVSSDAPGFQGGFPKSPDSAPAPPPVSKTMFTTILGVVVTTN